MSKTNQVNGSLKEKKFPMYSIHCRECNKNLGYSSMSHHANEILCMECFEK